jgi:hypothetical protein
MLSQDSQRVPVEIRNVRVQNKDIRPSDLPVRFVHVTFVVLIRYQHRNLSTRRKPAQVPLSPPQISRDLTWDLTRTS